MAKKPYRGGKSTKKKASPGNMMAQIQQMQQEMAEAQAALENETVTVTSGGGAVTLDPEEVEFLQEMLVAAVNSAIEQSQALSAEKMEGITGDMGINDMLGGLGL
jgi:DNA-binding protein YbaB